MDLIGYAMNHARDMSEVKGLPLSHKREKREDITGHLINDTE